MRIVAGSPRVGMLRWSAFASAAISCCVASACALAGKKGPSIGDAPPPLNLGAIIQGPAGDQITWANLRGKVVVLEFWGIGCAPCVQGIPQWNALVDRFASKPVVFLAMSDDNPSLLERFLVQTPMKGWLALDQAFRPTHTAFDVMGVPHTVVVNADGLIAAVTHPAELYAEDLEAILAGKPHSIPPPQVYDPAASAEIVERRSPVAVAVSVDGPVPMPSNAYNMRYWDKPDYQFVAKKAYLRDALTEFFDISPSLVFGSEHLPEGLYDISAVARPNELSALQRRFVETLHTKFGVSVQTETREVDVYLMTVANANAPGLRISTERALGGGGNGKLLLQRIPIDVIARVLGQLINQPVINETDLSGLWDADLQWEVSPAERNGGPANPASVISAAREQLGLQLKPVRRERSVLLVHPPEQ